MKTEPVKEIVKRLLDIQLRHTNALEKVEMCGVSLPRVLDLDLLDVIADWYGIPKDNTVETDQFQTSRSAVCDRVNDSVDLPDNGYCRDWIMDEWSQVQDGESTFDENT